MAAVGTPDAFQRLLEALRKEGIPCILIGMSAAIAQGVMGSTLDIDLWVDLPPRQSMRVQNAALASGATWGANTVVFLDDGTPVNFVYEVTGLGTFRSELRHTHPMRLRGVEVPVLDLSRIRKSKQAIRQTKDLLHLELIAEFLRCRRGLSAD